MATKNYEYILKRGEVGSTLQATLSDENGAVNLTGWTVTVTARKGIDTPVIDEGSCTLAANQTTTGKGKVSYEFTATTANIAAGTYDLEFKGTNSDGDVHYFPKSKDKPYATLTVIESLS